MPLIQSTLAGQLLQVLKSYPKSSKIAGDQWALAYDAFARTGTVMGIPAIFLPPATLKLQSDFGNAFKTPGVPAAVAAQIGAALSTYWLTATIAGMMAPPVPVLGLAPFITMFTKTLSTLGGALESKSQEFAAAFNVYTAAVVVPMPPVGATVPVL